MRILLSLCLLAWPARQRRTHGAQLLDTALALVGERRADGMGAMALELGGEAIGLVHAGLRLRWGNARRRLRAGTRDVVGDARVALRVLGRTPGFTSVAVLTLALGMGANGAVFSLVDAILLRPPPYERPDELVVIWRRASGSGERAPLAAPDAAAVAEHQRAVAPLAFARRATDGAIELPGMDAARHVRIAEVSPDFFRVLGVGAAFGRVLGARDGIERPLATLPPAVLAHRAWRDLFGADPGTVGREIRLNGLPVVVVGILPADFRLTVSPDAGVPSAVDVWVPLPDPLETLQRVGDHVVDQDSDNTGVAIGRLAAGTDLARAAEEVARVAAHLRASVPAHAAAGLELDVRRLHEDATADIRPLLLALTAGVGIVLLVACLNLAGLLSARGRARARELAVRSALGASRQRLVRQLVVEGAVLVGLGLVVASAVAAGLVALARPALPEGLLPPGVPLLRFEALAFTALVVGGVVTFAAVLPAARVGSTPVSGGLRGGATNAGALPGGPRRGLVVAQIALSVVLVLSAGLLLRTVSALEQTHPGFVSERALTFRISLRLPDRYGGPAERARYMNEVERRIEAVPGVEHAGLVGVLPLGGGRWTQAYGLPGQPEWEWQRNRADFRVVSSGFLDAIGARLLEGRGFTEEEDLAENERVVIVDRLLARRIAAEGSAVGATIAVPVDGTFVEARVVGVVEHIRYERLEVDGRETIYVPYRQEASREVSFVVRSAADPSALAPAIRDAAREVDARVPIHDLRTLEDYVDQAIAPRRLALSLLAGFAFLALASVVVGLYGVVAFDVSRRTREIGLRRALGAGRWEVVASVLRSGARTTAAGLAFGAVLGAGVAPLLGGLLHGVGGADPGTWAAGLTLVAACALVATLLPAVRAVSLSPTTALRSD